MDLSELLKLRWKIVEVCLSEEEKKIIFQDFQKPKLQKAEKQQKGRRVNCGAVCRYRLWVGGSGPSGKRSLGIESDLGLSQVSDLVVSVCRSLC